MPPPITPVLVAFACRARGPRLLCPQLSISGTRDHSHPPDSENSRTAWQPGPALSGIGDGEPALVLLSAGSAESHAEIAFTEPGIGVVKRNITNKVEVGREGTLPDPGTPTQAPPWEGPCLTQAPPPSTPAWSPAGKALEPRP